MSALNTTTLFAFFLVLCLLLTPARSEEKDDGNVSLRSFGQQQQEKRQTTDGVKGTCYFGSSSSVASNYPPQPLDCGLATGEVCYLRKVKDINYYEMGCQPQISCDRNIEQVESGVDLTYESYQCCKELDLCNNYEDFKEDGTNDNEGSYGSTNMIPWRSTILVVMFRLLPALLCQMMSSMGIDF